MFSCDISNSSVFGAFGVTFILMYPDFGTTIFMVSHILNRIFLVSSISNMNEDETKIIAHSVPVMLVVDR